MCISVRPQARKDRVMSGTMLMTYMLSYESFDVPTAQERDRIAIEWGQKTLRLECEGNGKV